MGQLSKYIFSVICASLILSVLACFFDKKGSRGMIIKMIGGLFLALTIISPIVNLDFSGWMDYLEEYTLEGEKSAAWGESIAQEEYRTIITQQAEAYILDKADALGAELSVEVYLSDTEIPLPEEAVLRGKVSPYAKTELQQMLETDLGIAKENQLWIG